MLSPASYVLSLARGPQAETLAQFGSIFMLFGHGLVYSQHYRPGQHGGGGGDGGGGGGGGSGDGKAAGGGFLSGSAGLGLYNNTVRATHASTSGPPQQSRRVGGQRLCSVVGKYAFASSRTLPC